jgi:argininosuccinate lyase
LQLLKEALFPALQQMREALQMADYMLRRVEVRRDIVDDPLYDYMFSVERVNRLVLEGVSFREAYRQVGREIESGEFIPPKELRHTHTGSIGNLCNRQIAELMEQTVAMFDFERVREAEDSLVG